MKMHKVPLPFFGLTFILLTVLLLNTPTFFTYRSRAHEDVANTIGQAQFSVETVSLKDNLPGCVASFIYTPVELNSLYSCLVQFVCADTIGEKVFFTGPHFACSQGNEKEGGALTCSENANKKECLSIDEWLKGAAITCGC